MKKTRNWVIGLIIGASCFSVVGLALRAAAKQESQLAADLENCRQQYGDICDTREQYFARFQTLLFVGTPNEPVSVSGATAEGSFSDWGDTYHFVLIRDRQLQIDVTYPDRVEKVVIDAQTNPSYMLQRLTEGEGYTLAEFNADNPALRNPAAEHYLRESLLSRVVYKVEDHYGALPHNDPPAF